MKKIIANEHKLYWKVTLNSYKDEEWKEEHNRVEKVELGKFLKSFVDEDLYFTVEPLSKEEFEETEK